MLKKEFLVPPCSKFAAHKIAHPWHNTQKFNVNKCVYLAIFQFLMSIVRF